MLTVNIVTKRRVDGRVQVVREEVREASEVVRRYPGFRYGDGSESQEGPGVHVTSPDGSSSVFFSPEHEGDNGWMDIFVMNEAGNTIVRHCV